MILIADVICKEGHIGLATVLVATKANFIRRESPKIHGLDGCGDDRSLSWEGGSLTYHVYQSIPSSLARAYQFIRHGGCQGDLFTESLGEFLLCQLFVLGPGRGQVCR